MLTHFSIKSDPFQSALLVQAIPLEAVVDKCSTVKLF